jgi:hypothetical protein
MEIQPTRKRNTNRSSCTYKNITPRKPIQKLLNGYHELAKEAEELNRTIALQEKIKEMKEIVPISYIARNYFGKSTAWLQQRIYGYKVRGRVYTLSEQDRLIFNNAIHDICNKLGSLSIA